MKRILITGASSGIGAATALHLDRLRAAGALPTGPIEHEGGDRSIYVEDPEGNVVEVWDFFERGKPVEALEED